MGVDLHIHTIGSDGVLSPEEIISQIHQYSLSLAPDKDKIKIISFTDHNYAQEDPYLKEEAEKKGIKLIEGVEISAQFYQQGIHILGYGLETICSELEEHFDNYTKEKTKQTEFTCRKSEENPLVLKSGREISISFEEISRLERKNARFWKDMMLILPQKYNQMKEPDDPVMDEEDARELLLGYTSAYEKFKETFPKLEKNKRLWYAHYPIEHPNAGKVISLIQKNNGFSCLAHPGEKNLEEKTIVELRQIGLDALEVYTPKNNEQQSEAYLSLCEEYGLLISGGTDSHTNKIGNLGQVRNKPITKNDLTILRHLF